MSPETAGRPALIVHDGAWDVPEVEKDAHLEGARRAITAGWAVLSGGGGALDAVVAAIRVMEDDPALNAGHGSVLCREGWVEMDAGLMNGESLEVGAAARLRDVPNPIVLAREILGSEHVLYVGAGASEYAKERGLALCDPAELVVERERRRLAAWRKDPDFVGARAPADTVGAVAVDARGHVVAGASTGGMVGKRTGRIGDTPIPGCGFYAEDGRGGAACTGTGEKILRLGLARRTVELLAGRGAMEACRLAVGELACRVQGQGGVILAAPDGSVGYAYNTPSMGCAYVRSGMAAPVVVGVAGR